MIKTTLALLAFAFASHLHAASADLRVSVEGPTLVLPGVPFTITGTVENHGPDPAVEVFVGFNSDRACNFVNQTFAPGERRTYTCTTQMNVPEFRRVITFSAFTPSVPDPNGANNSRQLGIDLDTPPVLSIGIFPPLATPGIRNPVPVRYTNLARRAASGATISMEVPRALGFGALPSNCTASGNTATCIVGPIPAIEPNWTRYDYTLIVEPILPMEHETSFTVIARIEGHDPRTELRSNTASITTARAFFVTNTSDAGEGSFRDAVAAAAAVCRGDMQCQIAFRIDSADAVKSIRLQSPIPRVVATRIFFDATTQTRYSGDTNPLGPEVELDGSALGDGDGLDLAIDCSAEVRGFALNGFPGYALVLRRPDCNRGDLRRTVHENYIGTDATGTRAMPNGRGIYVDVPLADATQRHSPWSIQQNLISGNRRAGIWVESSVGMVIYRNTIGLNATRTAALGNGASGIFINRGGYGTDVVQNFIGFNGHAGVAIAQGAQNVAVYANSIQANAQGGIDWNLDGPSPNAPVKMPVIVSAQYDPATNTTIIRGEIDAPSSFGPTIHLYANDAPDPGGYGEGQYYLGAKRMKSGPFEFRAAGDWRGKWISGVAESAMYVGWLIDGPVQGDGLTNSYYTTTSEFGLAVQAQ